MLTKHLLQIFSLTSFLFCNSLHAQVAPTIEWAKCYGGSDVDWGSSIQQTIDGGFIVAGFSTSNDGDISGNHGESDYFIMKLDTIGNLLWQKSLGGSRPDGANSIQQTSDGGFIVAGTSNSNDGDVTGHHGSTSETDYWVIKLDSVGNLMWQKSLGGTGNDYANSVKQTFDGGYIVAGYTYSNDSDVTDHIGSGDYWIVKLNAYGSIVWQKCLGGSFQDLAYSIQQTSDSGFIVVGQSNSNNGDVSGNHSGIEDYWIVKLDSVGNLQWQKCLGGSFIDDAHFVRQTVDGGFVVVGQSNSNDGDVSGNHGYLDYWVVKLDAEGSLIWQKSFGGNTVEGANSVQQTLDGGFIISGSTESNDGDVSGNHGIWDYWIVKIDSVANLEWQKTLGGSATDYSYSIQQTIDGGFITAGSTLSTNGNVIGNHGNYDCWIIKFSGDTTTGISFLSANSISLSPNPTITSFNITYTIHQPATLSITNTYGIAVKQLTLYPYFKNRIVYVDDLASGIYLVTLHEGNKISSKKVIVER